MSAENIEVTPRALHSFFNDDGTVLGHLVIDSSINGVSGGGIRMVPEMVSADLCHLARAMTLKYGFLKWPFGGAKAAILTHRDSLASEERRRYAHSFAEQLRPFVGHYLPGEDAGTNDDDLRLICKTAGLMRQRSIPDSGYFTALTVRICTERVAAQQKISLEDCRVAIEGFGKVGGSLAKQLSERGCRIVAVSTDRGAVYDAKGLDVDCLLRARETAGSDCVSLYQDADRIDTTELLTVPTDFLIPCALSWSINTSNARDIQARAIICGANNPVTEKARDILRDRDILYFPDFVANSGGVLGSIVGSLGLPRTRVVEMMHQVFAPKVEDLMTQAQTTDQPLEATARRIATANHETMKQTAERRRHGLFSGIIKVARRGLMPTPLKRMFGPIYIRKTMA